MTHRRTVLAALLSLGGCAPLAQAPGLRPPGFSGPFLGADVLVTDDGARLPMRVWPAVDAEGGPADPWGVFIALHGMDDYSRAFVLAGPYWARRGITTYAYDQRGFGRAPGRGVWPGAELLAADLKTACALVRARHPHALLGVVGESMGGAAAIVAFASPAPPTADRLVLLSPAVWGWSEQPIEDGLLLWLAAHMTPAAELEPPRWVIRSRPATDNLEILREMSRDPNLIFRTRIDAVYGLVALMERASRDISRLRVPTLYAYGAKDAIIPRRAAFDAVRRLPASARTAYYPKGFHLLNRDLSRERVLEDAAAFLRAPADPLPSGAEAIPAGRRVVLAEGRG